MQPFRSGRITVDGETFDVSASDDALGHYHLDWQSGPHSGYGFTCRRSDGETSTEAELVEHIRELLRHISPTTGYLD